MRFSCEHCGKKYVVKDELLPGRTYKSRCKVCGHVIVVKGDEGEAIADDAVLPAPDTGSVKTPFTPARPPSSTGVKTPPPAATRPPTSPFTPVSTPPRATPPSPIAAPPKSPTPPRAEPPKSPLRDDSGYIDLFDGQGFDEPAGGFPNETVRRVSATVIPPPPATTTPPPAPVEEDPFLRAARAAHSPTPTPSPATARPSQVAIVPTPKQPSTGSRRPSIAPFVIGGLAAVLVGALAVGAVLRPWRTVTTTTVPTAPTTPVPRTKPLPPEPPPEPPAEPPQTAVVTPPPAQPAPPPAAATPPQPEPPAKVEPAPEPEPEKTEKRKPEGLSAAAIRKVLNGAHKHFNRCLENPSRGLERPLPAHRISLRLSVEPSGGVTSVGINDPAVARAPVGQCLKTAALNLSFPSFRGPPALVDAPVDIPASPAPAAAVAKAEPPPVTPAKVEVAPPPKAEPPPPPPAAEPPPPPAGPAFTAVEFSAVNRARSGGEVGDTRYAQNSDDAEISDRSYSDGVLTYSGQLGKGHGSSYGGIGFYVNVQPGGHAMDASKYRTVSIKLASPTTGRLRVRIQGPEQSVSSAGCYPMMMVNVSENMKTYRLKLEDFAPESWCGGKGRSPEDTLPQLVGFEIVDTAVQGKPTKFSVGSITLHP
jgi:predicted Zn finger-like uncharacterized protein